MPQKRIYLDYNATTPIRKEVRDSMVETFDVYANASSMHESGRIAQAAVEQARVQIASLISSEPTRLFFTSGGSESNNTVFQTMLWHAEKSERNEIITSVIEHPCVMRSAEFLEKRGIRVHYLPVDSKGFVDMAELQRLLSPKTLLVSVMLANNELGTLQDIQRIASLAKAVGAYVHTDAVQAVGKIPVSVEALGVDYMSVSAHKLYGPKGVGALYVRKGAPFEPLIRGGHQEHGRRAGTYNTQSIVGFGRAAVLISSELEAEGKRQGALRDRLRDGLTKAVPNVHINGDQQQILPNTVNISFPGAEGEAILLYLDLSGIEASTGSACASGSLDPSPVLMATGVGPELAHGSIRFSLGKHTSEEDIEYVIQTLPPIIARLRAMSTVA